MAKLKIGVVMDPVDKINIDKDTTFVLMFEAQRRGHEIYFMELDDMFIRAGTVHSRYRRLDSGTGDAALPTGRMGHRRAGGFRQRVDAQRSAV